MAAGYPGDSDLVFAGKEANPEAGSLPVLATAGVQSEDASGWPDPRAAVGLAPQLRVAAIPRETERHLCGAAAGPRRTLDVDPLRACD
jgi:hypothetical protein